MKIIHILAGKANPNTLNGVNKVVDAIATEQTRLGYETFVIGVANNTEQRHYPIYNYKIFKKNPIPFFFPEDLLGYLLSNSTETTIFHFHSVFIPWFLPLIKKLKQKRRCHLFLTPHGQYIDAAMRSIKKKVVFHLFDQQIIKEVEAVHILGEETEYNSRIKTIAKRVAIIPNGFRNQPQIENHYNKTLSFGYLGRIICLQKGLDIMIPAFISYCKSGGTGILKIAGSGPDEDKLKQTVRQYGLDERILFLGKVFDDDKWEFIQNCSVFVHVSRWEGIPTACMEASSMGLPLLVTKETNLGPYITKFNSGLVLNELSETKVTNALLYFEQIFQKQEFLEMSKASSRMITEELNWAHIVKRLSSELYNIK